MIKKLFSWQIARGRNFSVATHPTKPFGDDFLASLIKAVCEGRYVVRHNWIMLFPGGRVRRGRFVGKGWLGKSGCSNVSQPAGGGETKTSPSLNPSRASGI